MHTTVEARSTTATYRCTRRTYIFPSFLLLLVLLGPLRNDSTTNWYFRLEIRVSRVTLAHHLIHKLLVGTLRDTWTTFERDWYRLVTIFVMRKFSAIRT